MFWQLKRLQWGSCQQFIQGVLAVKKMPVGQLTTVYTRCFGSCQQFIQVVLAVKKIAVGQLSTVYTGYFGS